MRRVLPILFASLGITVAALAQPAKTGPSYGEEIFGKLPDRKDKAGKTIKGPTVTEYTLTNKNGIVVKCIDLRRHRHRDSRARTRTARSPTSSSASTSSTATSKGHPYFGSIVGRVANRIAKGKFTLDGKEYTLATNNGPNHLHGGKEGLRQEGLEAASRSWPRPGRASKFTYTSPDGEEGYPGNLVGRRSPTR